jgi:hypothetical protein
MYPERVLTSRRKVDECKPVGLGGGGANLPLMPRGADPAADAQSLAPKLYPEAAAYTRPLLSST